MELHSTPQVARPPEQSRRITNNKPMMLKDYLWHDTSSDDGFLAYPRRLPNTATVRSLLELDHSSHGRPKFMRSSSKAASAAILKLHKASTLLLNAVKFIHHKPHLGNGGDSHKPSFLPRSLSRHLSKSKRSRKQVDHNLHTSMTVKVKDIMRWKSFTEANYMSPNKVLSPLLHGYTPSSKSDHGSSTTWSSCTWSDSDFSLELGSTCSSDFLAEQVGGYGGKRSPAKRERRREKKKGLGEEEEESVVAPATYYRKPKVCVSLILLLFWVLDSFINLEDV